MLKRTDSRTWRVLVAGASLALMGMATEMPINGEIIATGEKLTGALSLTYMHIPTWPMPVRFSLAVQTSVGASCTGYVLPPSNRDGWLSCSDGRAGGFTIRADGDRDRGDGQLGGEDFVLWFPAKPGISN
jgi:hypothetical protein